MTDCSVSRCGNSFCARDLCYPDDLLKLLEKGDLYHIELYCSSCLENGWTGVTKQFLGNESQPQYVDEHVKENVNRLFKRRSDLVAQMAPVQATETTGLRRSVRVVAKKATVAKVTAAHDEKLAALVSFVTNTNLEEAAIVDFLAESWKWRRYYVQADGSCLVNSVSIALDITPTSLLRGVHEFVNRERNAEEREHFHSYIDLENEDKKGTKFFFFFNLLFPLILSSRKKDFYQYWANFPDLQRVKTSWNYPCWNNGPRLLGCYVWETYKRKIAIWKLLLTNASIIQRTQFHPDFDGDYKEDRDIHLLQFRTSLVVHYDLLILKICSNCEMRGDHQTSNCKNTSKVCRNCNELGHRDTECREEAREWPIQDAIL